MESGQTLRGAMFIDATYEGDLMARAGVSYHVGREANAKYGETINGVFFGDKHQFKVPVDPYVVAGRPRERSPARASTAATPARPARATAASRRITSGCA